MGDKNLNKEIYKEVKFDRRQYNATTKKISRLVLIL